MYKILTLLFFIAFSMSAVGQNLETIFVEFDSKSIKVNGKKSDDLLASLNSLEQCEKVHLIVDKNSDHAKIVEIMSTIKKSKCENISIQSV